MTKGSELPGDASLPEETAHRVLARAVELDVRNASDISLARIREIAREAGIGDRAIESALREVAGSITVPTEQPREDVRRSRILWLEPVLRNGGAFAASIGIIGIASRVAYGFGAGWPVEHAAAILANVVGVGLSLRLRAKLSAFVLAVTAAAQLAEYPMHLVFGIETVQGGPTKLALMLAAALGIGFSFVSRRAAPGRLVASEAAGAESGEGVANPSTTVQQLRALLPRTA